jgi:nucleotide-binding universal stress UspA family protein
MQPFRKILVDVDALAESHPAVARAAELAALCGAQVTLADVLPPVPNAARRYVTERVEQELADHRRDRLAAIARTMAQGGSLAVAPVGLLLRGRPADAVIEEVISGGYDLLIRSHGRDLSDPVPSFGPIDKQLLRQCPCPVWIVSAEGGGRPSRILAAVDAGAKEPADVALNIRILALARLMQRLETAELMAVYAWEPYGESLLRSHMGDAELSELVENLRAEAQADLDALIRAADAERTAEDLPAPVRTALVRGEPERALPAYIREHTIDLVVMGTVGRKGLAGLVTGNTAERVLHELRGSVLAIKPEGFTAPRG